MRAATVFGRGVRVVGGAAALTMLAAIPTVARQEEQVPGTLPGSLPAANAALAPDAGVTLPERGEAGGRRDLATEVAKAAKPAGAETCAPSWGMLVTNAEHGPAFRGSAP